VREKSGFSQQGLASLVGVHRSLLNRVESEQVNPSLIKAFAIADSLKCKVDDIFFPSKEEIYRKKRKNGDNHIKTGSQVS